MCHACVSGALTVCEVISGIAVVAVTIAGIVDCVAMILAVDLVSFMMSLGTYCCGTVTVMVAAVNVAGSAMLAVTGVLVLVAVVVVVTAVAVTSGVMAEVEVTVIIVVVTGVTVVTEVDIAVVNCVDVTAVAAV